MDDPPLWKFKKFSGIFFFVLGWVEKKTPLHSFFFMGELKAFWGRALGGIENFGHFGQQTVATHKA